MGLQTFVKVGNVSNLSDARYCAGMGVDMIGFSLDSHSLEFVDAKTFKSITDWVAGVKLVGEKEEIDAEDVAELQATYRLDYLQLQTAKDWKKLSETGIALICKVIWFDGDTFERFEEIYGDLRPYISYFLLESAVDEVTEHSQKQIQRIAQHYSVLLGFGVTAATVKQVLTQTQVTGIALKGSHEIRPGFKEYGELADVLEALETDE
jgi:phosphoribosylanthranilate isomerase